MIYRSLKYFLSIQKISAQNLWYNLESRGLKSSAISGWFCWFIEITMFCCCKCWYGTLAYNDLNNKFVFVRVLRPIVWYNINSLKKLLINSHVLFYFISWILIKAGYFHSIDWLNEIFQLSRNFTMVCFVIHIGEFHSRLGKILCESELPHYIRVLMSFNSMLWNSNLPLTGTLING